MRIAVISKRQYTAKDLLDSQYGRLFEIPAGLAALGHEVRGLALSYRRRPSDWHKWPEHPRLSWLSLNAFPTGLANYGKAFDELANGWPPDAIWASSDAIHIALGAYLSKKHGIPLIADLYDNYESFGLTQLPGLKAIFRRSCRNANAITTVSNTLKSRVIETTNPRGDVYTLCNGVNRQIFFPMDRQDCRKRLNLPLQARIIGTAGALSADRGIDDLFRAFISLASNHDDLWLVLAGPRDASVAKYQHSRIIDLGILPLDTIGTVINALDISITCNLDSAFGRYCFPLKLQESLACEVPVIAAAVGDVTKLLENETNSLYQPGNWESLRDLIANKIELPTKATNQPNPSMSWPDLAAQMETIINKTIDRSSKYRKICGHCDD